MHPIRPIHSDDDHKAALAEVERLWDAKPGTAEHDRLEVLATLVDAYERARFPILPHDPIEAIKFRLEQQGLSRKALEALLGTRARVSEVLNRRRKLSLAMIRAIHRELNIPLEILISETTLSKGKRPRSRSTRSGRSTRSQRTAKKHEAASRPV